MILYPHFLWMAHKTKTAAELLTTAVFVYLRYYVSPQSSSVISKSKTPVAVQKAMGVILTHSIDLFRPIQTYLQ